MIAARYAQLHRDELAGLVLSDPLDVSTLSRDPRAGEIYSAKQLVCMARTTG